MGNATHVAAWVGAAALALSCGKKPANLPVSQRAAAPGLPAHTSVACAAGRVLQPAQGALAQLLSAEDTDEDKRITIADHGRREFAIPLHDGTSIRITGVYELATLVQELYLMEREGRSSITCDQLSEPVPLRMNRLIRERYWSSLTRRLDGAMVDQVLVDPKLDGQRRSHTQGEPWPKECSAPPPQGLPQFLYVPSSDAQAYEFYSAQREQHPQLVICRLPKRITPQWVQSLNANAQHGSRHGLLGLAIEGKGTEAKAVPYVVPGGRFNELYGWDSYFHVLGLLQDGHLQLARSVVDNQLYEVEHYGQVLNANRTYYLTRSQPPLLSSAVRAVWQTAQLSQQLPPKWLVDAVALLQEEYHTVWTGAARTTPLCAPNTSTPGPVCLSAYHALGIGEPPEVEAGHFDWLYARRAAALDMEPPRYRQLFMSRALPEEELRALDTFFLHDRSMRESGHDTTYRWTTSDGDRCADYATVDLNALLFKYELDLATLKKELGQPDWAQWCARAESRKVLVQRYLFDGRTFVDRQLDRDRLGQLTGKGRLSQVVSATTFYPLWASAPSACLDAQGAPVRLVLDQQQADVVVRHALSVLEAPGGLSGTMPLPAFDGPSWPKRQWDYPFGWAPHQILAWTGLRQFALDEIADRLTYRWLFMMSKNAHDYHGTVPEKYDVVTRSHAVFAEYGNVGTDFSYMTEEGFGWMNASFQLGYAQLPEHLKAQLTGLIDPQGE